MMKGTTPVQMLVSCVLIVAFLVMLLAGCAANSLMLETKVNDPIMLNLLDSDGDLSQVKDGTGVIGEGTACPT